MKTTFFIQNLRGTHSNLAIQNTLSQLDSVYQVIVNFEGNYVTFNHHNAQDRDQAEMLLKQIGYPVAGSKNSWNDRLIAYFSFFKAWMTCTNHNK